MCRSSTFTFLDEPYNNAGEIISAKDFSGLAHSAINSRKARSRHAEPEHDGKACTMGPIAILC